MSADNLSFRKRAIDWFRSRRDHPVLSPEWRKAVEATRLFIELHRVKHYHEQPRFVFRQWAKREH